MTIERTQNNEEGGRKQNEGSSAKADENFATSLPKQVKETSQSKTNEELEEVEPRREPNDANTDNDSKVIIKTRIPTSFGSGVRRKMQR